MSGKFNAAALASIEAALDADGDLVDAGDDELRRIDGAEVRQKCAAMKLAARMVCISLEHEDVSEDALLKGMETFAERVSEVRSEALGAVGVERESSDFAPAFNIATSFAVDLATEEWKWSRLGASPRVGSAALGKMFELAMAVGPLPFDADGGGDLKTIRRLLVLEMMPKLHSVANHFDYFQPDRDAMVARLAKAVSECAEKQAGALYSDASPTFMARAILQRAYGVSVGLMCEVFKEEAARDVARLRAMQDLDRAVLLAQYGETGMKYEHIIGRHREVMERSFDTAKLILEAQDAPQRPMEQNYGA